MLLPITSIGGQRPGHYFGTRTRSRFDEHVMIGELVYMMGAGFSENVVVSGLAEYSSRVAIKAFTVDVIFHDCEK